MATLTFEPAQASRATLVTQLLSQPHHPPLSQLMSTLPELPWICIFSKTVFIYHIDVFISIMTLGCIIRLDVPPCTNLPFLLSRIRNRSGAGQAGSVVTSRRFQTFALDTHTAISGT